MTHGIFPRSLLMVIIVCGISAACVALLRARADNPYRGKIRQRLGFSVLVDGEVKSASSVLEVSLYGGDPHVDPLGSVIGLHSNLNGGVAPILDLGSRGMLAAAMYPEDNEAGRRRTAYGLTCKLGSYWGEFWEAFGMYPRDLAKLRDLRRELPEKYYPSFIWIPNGASFRDAEQICWEEIPKVIPGVTFQSAWIELAPDASLLTLLPISAPWLEELRKNQVGGIIYSDARKYKINRQSQLETQDLRHDPRYDDGEYLKQ